jgi:hypothetical protein
MTARAETEPRIDVILGRCDDMRAEVYVRASGLPLTAEPAVISGTLTGPESRLAITLPTAARLVDLGPGPAVRLVGDESAGGSAGSPALARGILTEPGYWTPELPHRYRLVAELRADGHVIASCDRLVGLRRLGVRGRSLWLEGRRWVARGVACAASEVEPAVFRELLAAAVLDAPAEAICAAADESGVAIIGRCGGDPVADCLRWAPHPSVMLAVLPRGMAAEGVATPLAAIKPYRGTLLVGLEMTGHEPPAHVPEGIDCLVMSLAEGALPHEAWRNAPAVPVVASRPAGGGVRERRAACDRLQADLAAWRGPASWDWAGYL